MQLDPGNFRLTTLIFPWDDSGASQAFARPDKLVQLLTLGDQVSASIGIAGWDADRAL